MSWIGVDLDGTLAMYDGWGDGSIGEPAPRMADRVRLWLRDGREVRIVTARVAADVHAAEQELLIQNWTQKHFGVRLAVTCRKDFAMIELWDDRAIQVIENTGVRADGKI